MRWDQQLCFKPCAVLKLQMLLHLNDTRGKFAKGPLRWNVQSLLTHLVLQSAPGASDSGPLEIETSEQSGTQACARCTIEERSLPHGLSSKQFLRPNAQTAVAVADLPTATKRRMRASAACRVTLT